MPADDIVVAVFNTSDDTTSLLRTVLEQAGFVVVTALTHAFRDGKLDFEAFIRQHRPRVIVYDIAVPYDRNWRLFEHFRDSPACADVMFVVTTTNVAHVEEVAGRGRQLYEIVGKPLDLDIIVRAVKEAAYARPTQ